MVHNNGAKTGQYMASYSQREEIHRDGSAIRPANRRSASIRLPEGHYQVRKGGRVGGGTAWPHPRHGLRDGPACSALSRPTQ